MIRTLGMCLMLGGSVCLATAGARLWADCELGPLQFPARCHHGGETKLEENPNFPNCHVVVNTCKAAPNSVCGQFDGYGQPRDGKCIYHLSSSSPKSCRTGVVEYLVTIHFWRGGCGWDTENQCSCVFVEQEDPPPFETTFCDCGVVPNQ